jgi:hypothetical protein
MKLNTIRQLPVTLAILAALGLPGTAQVLLDDDWDDGDRTDTNLPEESAWFANNAAGSPTLSAAVGALIGNVLMFETNTSSRLWITHFTPAGSPTELGLGDMLKITLVLTASNVTTSSSTSRGLRIGLFNFSEPGAARVSADGFSTGAGTGAPGANVTGYMLNMNFAQAFTIAAPLQIMKRTDLPNINLMGASAVYSSLGSGGGPSEAPGFSNDVPYTLEFIVRRGSDATMDSVDITTRFSDTNGWSIEHTATDFTTPTFRFDGFAMRPNSVADTADSFTFSQFKVERIPFSLRIISLELLAFDTVLTFETLPGRSYEVQARAALDDANPWTTIGSVTAAGTTESVTDFDGSLHARRFYRVVQLPPAPAVPQPK